MTDFGDLVDGCCSKCGQPLQSGEWPFCPHGFPAGKTKGFEPRFDDGLGIYVTGWGDRRKAMREHHLDYRDHPAPGELSARRDRIEQQKRSAR